jgi:hypothetical protein
LVLPSADVRHLYSSEPLRSGLVAVEILVAGEAQLRANAQDDYARACQRRLEFEQKLAAQKAEAIRHARELAIKAERERRRNLLRMAAEHRKAEQMRSLIDQVVRVRGTDPLQADGVAKWAEWARQVADRTDPIFRLSFDAEGRTCLAEPTFRFSGTYRAAIPLKQVYVPAVADS